jgi:thiol-disulfide isomerase/thioredoxin
MMQLVTPFRTGIVGLVLLLVSQFGYSQGLEYTPDLSLRMTEFQEKVLQPKEEIWVLDFWATWCGPCIVAVPHMKTLQKRYADKSVRFISLSWDQSEAKWQSGLMRLQMPWQHLWIHPDLIPWFDDHFPHKGIPTAFVIPRDGKFKRVNDVYLLDKAIDKALKK